MSLPTAVAPASTRSVRATAPPVTTALIVAAMVFLAHLPLLITLFQELWLKPHYQLFPIVLVGAYALLWPLASFQFSPPGLLGYANKIMAAGIAILAVGMTAESIEGWSFGTASMWVAVGAIGMLIALPLEILGSPTQAYSGRANPRAGLTLVVVCWCIMLFCTFFRAPAITALSAIGVIASIPLTAGGWPLLRRCLPGLAFLLLIVPPPFGYDAVLVQNLQFLAAKASSRVLDFMGVRHHLVGVTIEVGDKSFMVEQGCSGISSLLSTLACVLFYVLWNRISWIRGSLLTISSIFWVLVNNITRIVGITFFGVGFKLFGRDLSFNLSDGIPHQIFGVVLFLLTLFMLWSTDRFLMFLGQSDLPRRRTDPMPASDENLNSSWRMTLSQPGAWLLSYGIAGAFGLLVALQALDLYALFVRLPYSGSALAKLYEGVDLNTMPERVSAWHRGPDLQKLARPAGDPLGQFSRAWNYRINPMIQASVSLDYPYPEFHDLRVCYSMQGWKFDNVETFDHPTGNQTQHCIQVRMHRPNERFAVLMYCSFDQDGVAVDPSLEADVRTVQERSIWDRATARFSNRINQWKKAFGPASEQTSGMGSILQVQLLLVANEQIPDNVVAETRKLFTEGVTRLRNRCIELKSGTVMKVPEEKKPS